MGFYSDPVLAQFPFHLHTVRPTPLDLRYDDLIRLAEEEGLDDLSQMLHYLLNS